MRQGSRAQERETKGSWLVRIGGDIFHFLKVAKWRRNKFGGKHLGSKRTSSSMIATGLLFVFGCLSLSHVSC